MYVVFHFATKYLFSISLFNFRVALILYSRTRYRVTPHWPRALTHLPPLPPFSCLLHQRGITPGSRVEPVKGFSLKAQLPPQHIAYSLPLGSGTSKWTYFMIFIKSGLLEGAIRNINDCDPELEDEYDFV